MTDRPTWHAELLEWCGAARDGTLLPGDRVRLEALLRQSAEARQFYARFFQLHACLEREVGGAVPPAPGRKEAGDVLAAGDSLFAGQDSANTLPAKPDGPQAPLPDLLAPPVDGLADLLDSPPSAPGTGSVPFSIPAWGWLASPMAVLAGVTLAIMLLVAYGIFNHQPIKDRLVSQPDEALAVAELRSEHDCVWAGARTHIPVGASLNSGQRLELTHGTARLLFQRGATVVIQSPAVFELLTATSMRLEQGTLAVRVTGPDKEFTVAAPDASIVDLGTSFGVHCGRKGATEVEVFEGAVEVYPDGLARNGSVWGMGSSVRVRHGRGKSGVDMVASTIDRFSNVLELLWEDMPGTAQDDSDRGEEGVVQADFSDGPVPGAVDTFYGAARGRGWLTPWVATGNPIGVIANENPLSGDENPYLHVGFYHSFDRAIARQYGARRGFDPNKPHVISWRWRFDGNPDHFGGGHFGDRIHFYGNPFFRRNSWPTNSWVIGVVGGHENRDKRRRVIPMRWYAFDGKEGEAGAEFERSNMVDTGMEFKPGVVYHFAVVVYPELARYDMAIRDDRETFTRTGLSFRNSKATSANVVHFGICSDKKTDDLSFSVDAIRIEQLDGKDFARQIETDLELGLETDNDEGEGEVK